MLFFGEVKRRRAEKKREPFSSSGFRAHTSSDQKNSEN